MKLSLFAGMTVLAVVSLLLGCGGISGTPVPQPPQEAAVAETPTPTPTKPPSQTPTQLPATQPLPTRTPTSIPESILPPTEIEKPTAPIPTPAQIVPASPAKPPESGVKLEAAARRLGISVDALREALGPPPPDIGVASNKLGISVDALRRAMGLPAPPEQPKRPPSRPGGAFPNLEAAARQLGIGVEALREALGPPPPDVPGASRKLGISPRVLREALGLPPKGRGPGAGRREGMPSPGATPMQPQPMATPVAPSAVPQPTPAATATSTPERTPAKSRVVTGKYLMSFSSCETATTGCQDPRNHEVYLAQSDDGVSWSLVPGWEVYPGSVPDVIRRGSTLYVYDRQYVTKYDLATDAQQVHWRGPGGADPAKQVTVEGLGQAGYVDPSLILDDQGRLVLFFMHGIIGADPAHCPPGEATCLKHFDSATEVEGSDGKRFLFDEGHRLTIAVGGGDYRGASDPDIFFDGSQYVLYISHGAGTSVWTSPTLRGVYIHTGDLSDREGGVPAGYFDTESGQYWTYAHVNQGGVTVIRRAVHTGLTGMLAAGEWSKVISAATLGLSPTRDTGSPGIAINE